MDLHGGNICADRWGYLKLIDFGIALKNDDPIYLLLPEISWMRGNFMKIIFIFFPYHLIK
jgi:predicted unusual protein kinase regulating ubiquinone biosynthesis (AarF/ABC1/UbiB family)